MTIHPHLENHPVTILSTSRPLDDVLSSTYDLLRTDLVRLLTQSPEGVDMCETRSIWAIAGTSLTAMPERFVTMTSHVVPVTLGTEFDGRLRAVKYQYSRLFNIDFGGRAWFGDLHSLQTPEYIVRCMRERMCLRCGVTHAGQLWLKLRYAPFTYKHLLHSWSVFEKGWLTFV